MSRRILIDVSHTFDHPFNTGVQRVVRQLATWARHWPETTFIRFDRRQQDFVPLGEGDVKFLLDGWANEAPTRWGPRHGLLRRAAQALPGSQILVDWFRTQRTKRAFAGSPRCVDFRDAVYLTAEVFGEADRTMALSWWLNQGMTTVVLIVHDLIPYQHPQWSIFNHRHFHNYLSILGRAHLLVSVSRHTQGQVVQWFSDQHRPAPRLTVVRPGFDLPSKGSSTPERARKLSRFLACIGTIETRKNQKRVLDALRRLWNEGHSFSFVFAGKETDNGDFRREYAVLRAEGWPLFWWNPASEDEVLWLYGNAEATIYVSLAEGFGLPIVESLLRGTPCITSRGGATEEIATDLGGCMLVNPLEVTDIEAALRRILTEPELRGTLVAGFRHDRIRRWNDYARDVHALVTDEVD